MLALCCFCSLQISFILDDLGTSGIVCVKNDDIERTEDNFFLLSIGIIFFVCPLLSLTDSPAPLLLWRRAGRCGTSVTGAEVKDVTGPESLLLPRNISLFFSLFFFHFN